MKKLIILSLTLSLTGCHISRSFQPPPEGYEVFYKHKYNDTPAEIVKKDMLQCGFPNVYRTGQYFAEDKNALVKSMLCMEQLGYNTTGGRGKICSIKSFNNTEACQNR